MLKINYLILFLFVLTACHTAKPPTASPIRSQTATAWAKNTPISPILNPYQPTTPMTICSKIDQNPCVTAWWQPLTNPNLDRFLAAVVTHNADFQLASLNLQKILSTHDYDNTNGTISIMGNASMGGQYDKSSDKTYQHSQSFSLNTNANFELDFLGKLKDKNQLSEWQSIANIYDYQGVYLSLTANAFKSYLNTIITLEKLKQTSKKVKFYDEQKKFNAILLKTGRISETEQLILNKAMLANEQALLSLQKDYDEQLFELSLISGQSVEWVASVLKNDKIFVNQSPPAIPENLMGDVVDNRVDIQASIYRLKAALNQPNLTKKSLYPSIVLTANGGLASNDFISLLKLPILNWGIGLNIPSLNSTQLNYQNTQDELNKQIAIVQYLDTLQKSYFEIEKSLKYAQFINHQFDIAKKELEIVYRQYQGNQKLYQLGRISYKELLEKEEEWQSAQNAMLDSRLATWGAWLLVVQALGL